MPRRLWLALGMLALGAACLTAAQLAGAARGYRQGGVFRVGIAGASVQIDPQLAYVSTAWWLEYATAAKLVNYPDRNGPAGGVLRPEVASRYTVSRDGRTWTFFIRKGFRFSDGSPVTAWSFRYAIDRAANHDLSSPAAAFITDPNGASIVGAKDVIDGKARHVRGVLVKGDRLIIHLTRPDGTFLAKLAMPFFQATSTKLPLTHELLSGYPSAGPYFVTRNDPNVVTELRQNSYYRGKRPRNLRGVELRWSLSEQAAFDGVMADQLDEGPIPQAQVVEVARRFGVNKTRFWAKPVPCSGWVLFNHTRGIFKNNVPLRKAVSWALDRTDYAAAAGPYAGSPWTHLLPPGVPGSIETKRLQPYAPRPRLSTARRLAAGHFRSGKVVIAYISNGSVYPAQANLVRRDLIRLGFKPSSVILEPYTPSISYLPPANWDIWPGSGTCADFPDPYTFFAPFLTAPSFGPGVFGLGSPAYEKRIRAANRLSGNARLAAFGKLDLELMRNVAPFAVMRTYNNRFLFSKRVDPKSLVYEGVYSDWSIPALALK